jgi:hypothetical protein
VADDEMGGRMSFSLPRFLRHIRPSDLEDYFERRDIRFPEGLDWNAAPARLLACLKAAIEALPDAQREGILDDFERVVQLTDDIGQRSLLALAEPDGALLRRFQSCHGRQARGLLVLLANEEAFDQRTCDRLCRAHAIRSKLERLPSFGVSCAKQRFSQHRAARNRLKGAIPGT